MSTAQDRQTLLDGLATDVLHVPLAELVAAWRVGSSDSADEPHWRLHELACDLGAGDGLPFVELGLPGSGGYLVKFDEVLARAGSSLRLVDAAFRGPPPGISLPPADGAPGVDHPAIGFVTPGEAAEAAPRVLALDDIQNNDLYSALHLCASEQLTMLFVSSAEEGSHD